MPDIVANGRLLGRPTTGVERYGRELLARLTPTVRVIRPPRGAQGPAGHLWEQFVLPARVPRGTLLWSPANTGPLAVRAQVVTIHDASPLDHPEWFARPFAAWYRFLIPTLARRARCVLTDSAFSKRRLVERLGLPESHVVAIAPGVGPPFQPVEAEQVHRVRHALGTPERYILTVGSLEPRKNLPALFAAWSRLAGAWPDVGLVVVGAGRRTFGRPGVGRLPARSMLTGRVDDRTLAALYGGASVFVLPSLYEGFGLPVLEAMACGTPVLASSGGALPETVGDAGLVVEPTADGLASGLVALLADAALRADLAARGRERARSFGWERSARLTAAALREAAGA